MKFPLVTLVVATTATAAFAQSAAPDSFQQALTKGQPSLAARLRYETVDQAALQNADSLTLGVNLGYTTQAWRGLQASVEGEATTPLVRDYYDGTGTNTTPATATVADPEIYELNQAWLSYTREDTKGTLGRQRIVLDNARFIGDVGWRQNQQTFDAFLLQDKTLENTTLTYAYLDRVNRIFDDRAAQYDWRTDSHLLNASYSGLPAGVLTGYAYLLDFDHAADLAAANSSQTYGVSFAGSTKLSNKVSALYRVEYATQSDYGSSALSYRTDYCLAELGAKFLKNYSLTAGYEVLGSDDGATGSSFRTPLATLHAHNGWADKFLTTPRAGLTDLFLRATATLPGDIALLAFYHEFGTTESPSDLGSEIDLQAIYKVNKNLSLLAKIAFYTAEESAVVAGSTAAHQDTDKFILQADYAY